MTTNPSDQEKADFANDALNQLSDDKMVQQFEDNVKQVGTWANQVDASFDNVTRKFNTMVETYGKDFPGFASYRDKWVDFNAVIPAPFFPRSALTGRAFQRWVKLLNTSRDVASEHVAVLKRECRSPFGCCHSAD